MSTGGSDASVRDYFQLLISPSPTSKKFVAQRGCQLTALIEQVGDGQGLRTKAPPPITIPQILAPNDISNEMTSPGTLRRRDILTHMFNGVKVLLINVAP